MMKILIAYDGSECARRALDDLTNAGLPAEAEAVIISVAEVWLPPAEDSVQPVSAPVPEVGHAYARALKVVEAARSMAQEAAAQVQIHFPAWTVRSEAVAGSPATEIILRADQWQPDLLVVGSHGRSAISRFVLGSVSQQVVSEARCPVRVARGRADDQDGIARLVLGADGSAESDMAVHLVASRLWPQGSEVRVVTAFEPFHLFGHDPDQGHERVRALQQAAEVILRGAGLNVSLVAREGNPKKVILEEAEDMDSDCIFVGATGHSLLERITLGSVSAAVAARAQCSVEVVRRRE